MTTIQHLRELLSRVRNAKSMSDETFAINILHPYAMSALPALLDVAEAARKIDRILCMNEDRDSRDAIKLINDALAKLDGVSPPSISYDPDQHDEGARQ